MYSMPFPIRMHFPSPNGNAPYTVFKPRGALLKPKPKPVVSLRSPMVARVHNAPPGCSSCGKR